MITNFENIFSPAGNTGGTGEQEASKRTVDYDGYVVLLHDGEKSLPVVINRPVEGEIVAIDWFAGSFCNSTFGDEFLGLKESERDEGLDKLSECANEVLNHIFGFGIEKKRSTGMHFYSHSWELVDGFGMFLAGHSTGRFSFDINATGLAYAKEGWQSRLHTFLIMALRSQITRIDLAYDDFDGVFSVDWALDQYKLGGFTLYKHLPSVSQFGNWIFPDGKGRTLNVGKRQNGKLFRSYEKGKQLGDETSEWVRHELELRNKDRIIPFDVLMNPTSYFRAAYPCILDFPMDAPLIRIALKQKESKITWNKALSVLSTSYGKYLHQFRQVYTDDVILNMLTHDKTEVPKRLIPCEILAKRHFESFINSTSDSTAASDTGSQVKKTKEVQS